MAAKSNWYDDDEFILDELRRGGADSHATETLSGVTRHRGMPERIGPYHIKRVIASGGMGTVYEAMQAHPRRAVALKVMRQGIASQSAMRRFEYESQVLARLHHAAIAQVYDAGTHSESDDPATTVPYFAMEYIPSAKSITQYARDKKLGIRARLELFGHVCDAVQHGHQKGIIHRDLKPGNILVDTEGQIKVIDFGVARTTDSDLAVTTQQTDVGQLVGTLQYMSPEQCEADPHNIDTRSDVYSLGVVLYELLTDRLPYDVSKSRIYEATRVIKEQQPTKLSMINKALRGDVETIALKALEKERERRYQSADELRRDIHRYLNNEPISARPPSMVYQLHVLARRHRAAFAAAATVLLVLVLATAFSTTMFVRARTEADKSDEVSRFLTDMLEGVGPSVAMGRDTTLLKELLDQTAERIGEELADQPEVEAEIRNTIGVVYIELGEYAQAEAMLHKALDLRRGLFGDEHADTLDTIHNLARAYHRNGNVDIMTSESIQEANRLFQIALEGRRRLLGEAHPDTVRSIIAVADAALADAVAYVGPEGRQRLDATVPVLQEAVDVAQEILGPNHLDTLRAIKSLAFCHKQLGHFDEAERLLLDGRRIAVTALGDEHPFVLATDGNLGDLYWKKRDYAKAEATKRSVLERSRRVMGEYHERVLGDSRLLARVQYEQGRFEDAERLLLEALERSKKHHGADNTLTISLGYELAVMYITAGRYDEAEAVSREALGGARMQEGHDIWAPLLAFQLALALIHKEEYEDAEQVLRESLAADDPALLDYGYADRIPPLLRNSLGAALAGQGRYREAEPLVLDAQEQLTAAPETDVPSMSKWDVIRRIKNIVLLYELWDQAEPGQGYAELAAEWRAKLPVENSGE